jgi:hypothetical protein
MPEIVAVAVADEVADSEVDEAMDARRTNADTAKLTIIPPTHGERENSLTMTKVIQTPPGMTSEHAITALSQDTSRLNASTLNVPGNRPTK